MTLVYILIVPSLVFALYMIVVFRKKKKHDDILYRFCQVRRDAIAMIDRRNVELSRKQYASIRNILESVNAMIHNYEQCKTTVFNFRKFVRFLKFYRDAARQAESIHIPNDPEIIAFHHQYKTAIIEAFLAYTPLIKSEICVKLLVALFVFLAKAGLKSLNGGATYLIWLNNEIKNSHDGHNGHNGHNGFAAA
jgi:hypothetical protein